jgi:hypothetical protein
VKINKLIKYLVNLKNNSGSYDIAISKLKTIKDNLESENISINHVQKITSKNCCYQSACNSLNSVKEKIKLIVNYNE